MPMHDMMPSTVEPMMADRGAALLQVAEVIAAHHDLPSLFQDLAQYLPVVAPFDFVGWSCTMPPARDAGACAGNGGSGTGRAVSTGWRFR